MFSPSRAGGSFLSHEGGEKASDGKLNSSRLEKGAKNCIFRYEFYEKWHKMA